MLAVASGFVRLQSLHHQTMDVAEVGLKDGSGSSERERIYT